MMMFDPMTLTLTMMFVAVVTLAMQHVNANTTILSNYDLDILTFNGRCMASVVMHKFINIITSRDYKVGSRLHQRNLPS